MENKLKLLIDTITDLDEQAIKRSKDRWASIAKPLDSLGLFEQVITQISGITKDENVNIPKRKVVVMCADNGVVCEGVTQTSSDVTKIVAINMTKGESCVCNMAKVAKSEVLVVDIGMFTDVSDSEQGENKMVNCKIKYGTDNIAKGSAMTREECVNGILVGIDVVENLAKSGVKIIATGEMGIGNTTTSSAVASVLTGCDVEKVTGKGAGLTSESLKVKIDVIKRAIQLNQPNKDDIIDVISKVGGLDIAGLIGVFLGGAIHRVPIVIDGFISSVAALSAIRMCDKVSSYMIASHVSNEPAGKMLLKEIGKQAFLTCNMCLGEGTGAVLDFLLLDAVLGVYQNMATFENANIEQYVPLT